MADPRAPVPGDDPPPPRVAAERTAIDTRFFRVVEEDLVVPGAGATDSYTYFTMAAKHDAVVVVARAPDGRYVVERIWRQSVARWLYEFPTGGIDVGEDPVAAGVRELREETGWSAGSARLVTTYLPMPGLLRMRVHLVACDDLSPGTAHLDPMELLRVQMLSAGEIEALCAGSDGECSSFLSVAWRLARAQPAG